MYINIKNNKNKKVLKKVAQLYFNKYMETRDSVVAEQFEAIRKILKMELKEIMAK